MDDLKPHLFDDSLSRALLDRGRRARVPWAAVCLTVNFGAAVLALAVGLAVAISYFVVRNVWLAAWDALRSGFQHYPWKETFMSYPLRAWRYCWQDRPLTNRAFGGRTFVPKTPKGN